MSMFFRRGGDPTPDQSQVPAVKCPACGGPTTAYAGPNPHKQGSVTCGDCGQRSYPHVASS